MIFETVAPTVKHSWNLPKGWEQIPLGSLGVAEIIMGQSPPSTTYNSVGQGLPFFQGKAEFGDLYPNPVKWCTSPKKKAFPGDVLISVRAPVGSTNLVREECCIGRGIAAIRPKKTILTRYLLYALRSRQYELSSCGRGSTFASIGKEELSTFSIPIPFLSNPSYSLDIQNRIVSRIESLVGELKGDHQLLDKMRRDTSRFLEMKLEEIFENLQSVRQPLIDVIESPPRNGWSPKCDNNPNGTPVLKLGAVLRFQYNPDEFKRTSLPTDPNAHYWLKPGDVLISRSNTLELVGHAAIYSGTPSPCIYPDLMMRIRVDQSKADSRFLVYWLQSKEVRHFIQSRASGASPTMKKINQGHVCNIPFPVISLDEQRQLAHYLDSIQSEVNEMLKIMQQDAKLLERLEQAILEKAFQGQL